MSLCLKKKKKQPASNNPAPRSRWGQQWQSQTPPQSSNNKIIQQLNQAKRERAEKQQKMYAKQMGWSLISENEGQKTETAFEKVPNQDEQEDSNRSLLN